MQLDRGGKGAAWSQIIWSETWPGGARMVTLAVGAGRANQGTLSSMTELDGDGKGVSWAQMSWSETRPGGALRMTLAVGAGNANS